VKITLQSTSKMVQLEAGGASVPARLWEGHTDSGIPVHCFVTRIAAPNDGTDLSQFERELQEHAPPSAALQAYPLRMVL
jgi:hypothetical protein